MKRFSSIEGKTNVVLVGMPGAGKSTIGVLLAKKLALDFIDTDLLIQVKYGDALQEIVDTKGYLELRKIEEEVIYSTGYIGHVIATGGSAIYSEKAMEHLKKSSYIVFLDVTLAEINRRIVDFKTRGIAMRDDQTFEDLFSERYPLYKKHADFTIRCNNKNQEVISGEICEKLLSLG
ncbi:shikimate kinase [bacterium]|nr:shikimate kinase [bacterium]